MDSKQVTDQGCEPWLSSTSTITRLLEAGIVLIGIIYPKGRARQQCAREHENDNPPAEEHSPMLRHLSPYTNLCEIPRYLLCYTSSGLAGSFYIALGLNRSMLAAEM